MTPHNSNRLSRRLRSAGMPAVLVAATLFTTGCVYFNGIYNAREAANRGDAQLRRGDESAAATFFATSAASAESVLVRHPNSSWRQRALFLAGRGQAMASFCDLGVKRLDEYLSMPVRNSDSVEYNKARLARGMCDLRLGQLAEARIRLHELIDVSDRETARQARLWASRAALAARDGAAAERYLEGMNLGTMSWELLTASVGSREYVRVESLLVQRAREGDYRADVIGALRVLLNAGRFESAVGVVNLYDEARVPDPARVSMHYLVGDYSLQAGHDSLAQRHLYAARQLAARDTVTEREAASRLALIGMRRFEAIRDLDSAFVRQDSAMRQTLFSRRIADQVLLMKMLAEKEDSTGAALFLAAEVARDSLRANAIARGLFLRLARDIRTSPLAATAWYAASLLEPDSADSWKQRILVEHDSSNIAAWLRGEDPSTRPDFASNALLLKEAWVDASKAWADTVRKLRLQARSTGGVQLP